MISSFEIEFLIKAKIYYQWNYSKLFCCCIMTKWSWSYNGIPISVDAIKSHANVSMSWECFHTWVWPEAECFISCWFWNPKLCWVHCHNFLWSILTISFLTRNSKSFTLYYTLIWFQNVGLLLGSVFNKSAIPRVSLSSIYLHELFSSETAGKFT